MIDLHTHSAISDGTDTVLELVAAARAAGISVLSLTDHDTMDGVDLAQQVGAELGVEVLRGMEMSTHLDHQGTERSIHLLAYGCRADDAELAAMVGEVRAGRSQRIPKILERLAGLGMPLDLAEIEAVSVRAVSIGRPHVADAMVAHGYVASRDEAFHLWLNRGRPGYVSHGSPHLAAAVDAVGKAGGAAVLAHPWGRGTRSVLSEDAIADLAATHGLVGIEVDHVDHCDQDRALLRGLADDLGLVVTGSSDYHGLGKTRNPLGVCQTDISAYQAICQIIEERGGQP